MEMVTGPLRFGLLTTCFLATLLCRIIGAPVGSSLACVSGRPLPMERPELQKEGLHHWRHDWLGSRSLYWNVIAKFIISFFIIFSR